MSAVTATIFSATWLLALAAAVGVGAIVWCGRVLTARARDAQARAELYRNFFDAAEVALFELAPDGSLRRANAACVSLLGFTTAAELRGLPPTQIALLFGAESPDALLRVATSETEAETEVELQPARGTAVTVRRRFYPRRDGAGQLTSIQGQLVDVTDQHRSAAALTASQEHYRVLFDHLPIGIVEYDYRRVAEGFETLRGAGVTDLGQWLLAHPETLASAIASVGIVSANPATMRLFGLSAGTDGLMRLEKVYAGDVSEVRRETFVALWAGRTEADGEFTTRTADGQPLRMFYYWRVPVIEGRPSYERTQLALVDVTEIKSAEQALAAERERLSVTLRSMSEAVVTLDDTGIVQFMNDAAAQLTGWPVGAAIGRPLREVCVFGVENTGQPLPATLSAALSTGRAVDLPPYTTLRPREGAAKAVEGRCAPVHDPKGRIIGAVLVLRDITHRARLEADLLRASKMESIGVLAGGIAHDFNNLLSIVMGSLSLALMDEHAKAAAGKWLREAERATLRARDLTQQLLTFAKGGEPVKAAVSLGEVVRETAMFALHGAAVKREFNLASDLLPANADKGQISQVVQNLVINAVQAMPNGGVVRVSLRNEKLADGAVATLPAGDYLRLEVGDTGKGISPDHLARIFEPFFTTKESGSGLGLATVYSIIKKHRGHIGVESTVGAGTTFRIWLPAARVEPVVKVQTTAPFDPLRGRVLFMDDEEPIRNMTKALLERLGLEVKVTAEGGEAVRAYAGARAEGNPFDVVVFDLTVPGGMGGADAMREILKIDPNAKGIVSSGYSSDPVMANYRAHGFRGSMPKPYRMADFSRMIREVLQGS